MIKILKSNKYKIVTILSFIFLSTIFLFDAYAAAPLGTSVSTEMNKQETSFLTGSGFESQVSGGASVGGVMALVIKGFLSLLGIIFVVLIITAGYNWMTAAGEEEKINKAKDTLKRAIIGLIIVVSAYAITYFVFTNLPGGEGSQQNPIVDI